jgi:hypothetical protein
MDEIMISEIDINDIKELYKLERNTEFKLAEDPKVPPASLEVSKDFDDIYKLIKIDGMYSYCIDVLTNEVHHFAAWTKVKPL